MPPPPPLVFTAVPEALSIDWEKVLYVVFDLETTGRVRQRDEIIEVGASIYDENGIAVEDAHFSQFVKPSASIPPFITQLTTITDDDVADAEAFPAVADAFIRFMQQHADENDGEINHIILVGHNAKVFDIPFFVQKLCSNNMADRFFQDERFGFAIDTLRLAKYAIQQTIARSVGVPTAYNLPTLFQFVTGQLPLTSHRANSDVDATATIFRFPIFWEKRKECVFQFFGREDQDVQAAAARLLNQSVPIQDQVDDSDTSVSSASAGSLSSSSSDEETDDDDEPLGDRWQEGLDFDPPAGQKPTELFDATFTSSRRTSRTLTGLLCSPIDVNTPMRAWRQVFTNSILDKIVRHTNEYGRLHAKRWGDITRKDLESFIAILFISGIQKRKDKPTNWFSDNRILENQIMKKVMSGRKFFTILRYLHCCPVQNQNPAAPDYDPSYKVAEIRDKLEERYRKLFVPGQQLSLDETLVRAFGRIKFKVRIVTKAARYGIKIYVITDAATAFVLRVVFYTGKSTYYAEADAVVAKKTVQVVNRLVEWYKDSHRTIYVDRFYTSMELLKSLAEKKLYVTGTMMANRIPLGIRIAKTSPAFRRMKRGDATKFKIQFRLKDGTEAGAGLVCWRDRQLVYCLSNDSNNYEFDNCNRRGEGGIVTLPRPISIGHYNQYMGGVDLADMRRLHCNSTIMGQNRWWLKLFFYLLDVGTSNALVLHKEFLKNRRGGDGKAAMNIVQFKMLLVEGLVGKSMDALMQTPSENDQHVLIQIEDGVRSRCAYCALMSKGTPRTRYQCAACGVPLCAVGSSPHKVDCFALAHETNDRREMVLKKYLEMQKRNSKKK